MTINRRILHDSHLTYKAKGIYFYLSHAPSLTRMTQNKIQSASKNGVDAVRSGLYELINHGYLQCLKQSDGTIKWILR